MKVMRQPVAGAAESGMGTAAAAASPKSVVQEILTDLACTDCIRVGCEKRSARLLFSIVAGLKRSGGIAHGGLDFVEGLRDALGGSLVEKAHDDDGDEGEDEARKDFVEAEPGVVVPDEDRDGAGDHARERAVARHAAPPERHDDDGAEGRAEEADGDGAREAEAHPEGGDAAGVRDHLDGAGGHEAHEDVRLAEVAQTPGEKADDAHEGVALEDVEHLDVDARDALGGGGEAAEVVHDGDRRHDQGEAHEESLNRVGPGDGEEAAHEDVADRGGGAQNEGRLIGHAEGVLEEAGARDHARGAVDREEEQDHDGEYYK